GVVQDHVITVYRTVDAGIIEYPLQRSGIADIHHRLAALPEKPHVRQVTDRIFFFCKEMVAHPVENIIAQLFYPGQVGWNENHRMDSCEAEVPDIYFGMFMQIDPEPDTQQLAQRTT